jgi:nucleoside-diphosphate-sugar epimerase
MAKVCRKILVTGGAGFVGSHLIPQLLMNGHSITVLDNLSTGKIENLKGSVDHPKFTFYQADITDGSLTNIFEGIDAVIHLAAAIDVSASVTDPTHNNKVNVDGTFNMLHAAVRNRVKKFVFASSTAVYGETKSLPIQENSVPQPISPYAASKVAGEAYCNAFSHCYGIETIALRFFNIYGLRSENSPYSGVITKFLQKTINGETLTIDSDGEQIRDFIHIDDVVRATLLALKTDGHKHEVFNVCTGTQTSINQLVATVKQVTGKKISVKYGPARLGDIRINVGNPAKATEGLLFKANVDLVKGLQALYEEVAPK